MTGQRLDYSSERQRHEKFVGREDLLARLDQLLIDGDADRWVVVTGGPGMGKSAILAAWLAQREAAGATVPHHFIRRGQYDWDDPAQLVGSLVAQLEDRFAALREPEADARMHPAARLARILLRVSERELVPRAERLAVLIDGLDEYDPAARTPPGDLDAPTSAADNETTVRAFWESAAGSLGLDPESREDARFLDQAVARAGGNVQHAVQLRKQLAALPADQRRAARHRIDDIPRGLQALIAQSWERIAADPVVVNGLGILCAAREALSLDELATVAGWASESERRVFVGGAMELLVATQRSDGTREYRLHHDSIRTHIGREIGSAEAIRNAARRGPSCRGRRPSGRMATRRRYELSRSQMPRAWRRRNRGRHRPAGGTLPCEQGPDPWAARERSGPSASARVALAAGRA